MALPLKSGADLYNNQALRLRLHNLGADPTEVGAGLIYFNTSTGLNTSQKARLYTGSAWKTIAFSEDLDVASNADFLALKDKVDTLIGDGVDMDGIIESWKEVEAFLSGMSDTQNLMDYLNTELGKKLDRSGGEMTGKLVMYNRISMGNQVIEMGKGLFGAYNDGEKLYWLTPSNETWNEILTSAGGTIDGGSNEVPLVLKSSGTTTWLKFTTNDGKNRYIGVGEDNTLKFQYGGASYPILHFGNVGECKAGDSDKLGGVSLNRFVYGDNATKTKGISEDDFENPLASGFYAIINASNLPAKTSHNTALHVSYNAENLRAGFDFLIGDYKQSPLYFRPANGDGVGDWKTIAFTDSDITGNASGLKHKDASLGTYYLAPYTYGFSLEGQYVTLRIKGTNIYNSQIEFADNNDITRWALSYRGANNADKDFCFTKLNEDGTGSHIVTLNYSSGNVLIGTTTELKSGSKLQVKGDLYVEGNIIATKEVSAGGSAEEGGNAGGGGAFHSDTIKVDTTQKTITHGLGTDDIVVSIYEKDGVSGRWSLILTDVEIVDANNIIVSFGSATSVEHKVVIMGAVA